ncbi:MAG: diacylglycerol kinase [Rhodanobacteraceae bacterium]|nr:diacylglycerol kinase [Xanthomonadales bacterium]MCP5477863.1 diacylglycerol kinase [Rhodanobacteraceae bacterium]HPF74330.1 diacylglycerol kinase [Xanthomonadaceae bacterium]HRY00172.1 diacylglycerol kinase [Xanthomonadaceae bacterium]
MADGRNSLVPRGPLGVWKAFIWSVQGLIAAFRLESSFRLEVLLFLIAAPLGYWLGESAIERVMLIGCLLPVMAAELLNSSIEALIERYGNERHEWAGLAKDMGSAAVFLLMMNVLICWGLILLPRLAG